MDTDVAIVGAGPTGLLSAILLNRCGVRLRILDKNDQSAHESRAFVVQPKSLELLDSIGLADAFLRRGLIAPGVQMIVNGHPRAEINMDDLGVTDTPFSFLFMLPQNEIEEILLEELARLGVSVERQCEVTGLSQDERGVRLATTRGEITAAYVVGADGAHSIVRKSLGLSFEGGAYPQTFMLADCAMEWPYDHEHVKLFFRGSALALYLPLPEEGVGRILALEPERPGAAESEAARTGTTSEPVALEDVERSLRAAAGPNVRLSRPRWTTRYRIHHRGVDRYGVGRVFVAGDAAHIHSPVGGQGMNTGLQDAANLAWKIAAALRGRGGTALLDTYHAERHPVGQRLLSFTDRAFSVASSTGVVPSRLRNFFAPRVARLIATTGLRKKAFRFVSQLGIRYEPNAFVHDDAGDRPGPRAGHRAPNADITRHRDVFDLLEGYRFHLLALSRKPMRAEEIARAHAALAALPDAGLPVERHLIGHSSVGEDPRLLQAQSTQVFTNYGLAGRDDAALFLVRPDGYVAHRSDGLDTRKLAAFLQRFAAP